MHLRKDYLSDAKNSPETVLGTKDRCPQNCSGSLLLEARPASSTWFSANLKASVAAGAHNPTSPKIDMGGLEVQGHPQLCEIWSKEKKRRRKKRKISQIQKSCWTTPRNAPRYALAVPCLFSAIHSQVQRAKPEEEMALGHGVW